MPKKKLSTIEGLKALPYMHFIDGKPYVRFVYRDATGKTRHKHKRVNSIDEAIEKYEKLRQEFGERGPEAFDGDRMTFDELLTEYEKVREIEKWYKKPLEDHFGQRRIKAITYGDIEQFRRAREATKRLVPDPNNPGAKMLVDRKTASINRELEALRAVLLYAWRMGWISRNPFTGAKPLIRRAEETHRDRFPSPEEEAAILAQCVEPREHLRAILIAARDTGLRKSALLALTWTDVDLRENLLRVPEGNRYKKRPKAIGITARLKVELLRLWEKAKKAKTPTIEIFKGIKDPKRAYATACRLAGVRDLHFHDWRHGYVTDLMEAGVEERLAMKLTGHTNSEIHARYMNVDERLARSAADKLDRLHRRRQGSEANKKLAGKNGKK